MNSKQFLAILYSDIFDYPLTSEELNCWQINLKVPNEQKALNSFFSKSQNYFFLKNKEKLINLRKKRLKFSETKLIIAKKAAKLIGFFPTVKMVAITGNLTMNNADKDDDIDFLVVSTANTLWLTRLLVSILLTIIGKKRKRLDKKIKDKICLNMFLDENHLQIPPADQNLYIAHEILQLKPILEKDNCHLKLLNENIWIYKYLPNKKRQFPNILNKKVKINKFLSKLDYFLMKTQIFFMKGHQTGETVSKHLIKFHPQDKTSWVLTKFHKKVYNYYR